MILIHIVLHTKILLRLKLLKKILIVKVILQKYTYNSKATKIELKNTNINLPIKPDNTPDYDYMSTFISTMQKVVIKDVVDYLDKRIDKTKQSLV